MAINHVIRYGKGLLQALTVGLTLFVTAAPVNSQSAEPSKDTSSLVLLLRHALAPGGGDPAGFDVNDCRTQRNLSDEGRDQARHIGKQLKDMGMQPSAIWSSQWCRSFETATLMDLGKVSALPWLNSYFQNRAAGPAQIEGLRHFLRNLDPTGGPYIMSSHHVVIGDLTDIWVGSGDGVWIELTGRKDQPWNVYPVRTDKITLPPGY